MSKHRAIAQAKMAGARRMLQASLRELRLSGRLPFATLHRRDAERARQLHNAYWLASDCMPPQSLRGRY